MKIINYLSRIIIGLVFIFSGIVKAIDPLGTVYKFQDYFTAFNLTPLKDLSLLFAIILCLAEFISGFSVLFNIKIRFGIWITMLLMIVFTPLTFVLALTNPVSDCGCFGDAIHLTNWQTFFKNLILLAPAIWLFINRQKIKSPIAAARSWSLLSITGVCFIAFLFYNLRYLPVIDFLPYSTGTYIPGKMTIPEGKPLPEYETTFIYEKEGQQKEFSLTDYPANDTTWKFVDSRSVLVSKGYTPPIHDFVFTYEGTDIAPMILAAENYTLLMVARKLNPGNSEALVAGYNTGRFCMQNGIDFYVLSAQHESESVVDISDLKLCGVDEITLKTMVRSDPGFLLLKNGTILHKWSWASLPENEELLLLTNKN